MKPTLEQVREAVQKVQNDLAGELREYQLVLFTDGIEASYGGWLVPAEWRPAAQPRKSYELFRIVSKVEDLLHDLTDSTVTIDLKPAA